MIPEPGGGAGHTVDRPFKHIFLGIDGTWQAAYSDMFYSNVYRMNVALNCEGKTGRNPQIFNYSPGLGTANPSARIAAGVFAEGLDESVLQAYINLVSNYVPGDKIYVFGFSRGAVAAQALTRFITYSGLLKSDSSSLTEAAWRYFLGKPKINYAMYQRASTHPDVKIDFLGVWDTVIGPYKKDEMVKRYRFSSMKLDPCVKHGVHVISIDESRSDFVPLLWSGPSHKGQILEQIWMPGVHGDVGGGYSDEFLSNISLLTMIDKLAESNRNLDFNATYIEGTLLPVVINQDVVVNNEWKHYAGRFLKWWYGQHRRRVDRIDASNQFVHPLTTFITQKEIMIREMRGVYTPSYQLSTDRGMLACAKFASDSWYLQKLKGILEKKCAAQVLISSR
jgi:hypothetical protein